MKRYLALVAARRWWVIASAVFFWSVALVATLILPAKFRSETVILVDQEKALPQYVAPNVTMDLQQRMQSLSQQILSRTRLIRIMDSLHLYGKRPDQPVTDQMIQQMRNDITVELTKDSGRDSILAFKVSYSAPSAVLAQSVTGELTTLFINENLRDQQQQSADTTAFLDSQLAAARQELEHQEQRLGEIRRKYMGELPEQLPGNVQILSGLQSRLQAATAALHQAEQQRLYLASMINQSRTSQSESPGDDAANPVDAAGPLDDQIQKMQTELADLTTRYTPEHPDVVRLREQIAKTESLKKQLETEGKSKSGATSASRGAARGQQTISPLTQLNSQLKATDLEISNRRQEAKEVETEIERYQSRLNLTPMREQELADAGRDHEESLKNYNSLLEKRKQSVIVEDITKRKQDEQFSVLDPPSLPQKPYWPNSLQFCMAGLAGGLFAALALIIVREASDPRVRSEEEMRQWMGIKVVALIPPLLTPGEAKRKSWKRSIEIVAGSLMALLVPAVTLFVYLKH